LGVEWMSSMPIFGGELIERWKSTAFKLA
jgi:hypothetical protein